MMLSERDSRAKTETRNDVNAVRAPTDPSSKLRHKATNADVHDVVKWLSSYISREDICAVSRMTHTLNVVKRDALEVDTSQRRYQIWLDGIRFNSIYQFARHFCPALPTKRHVGKKKKRMSLVPADAANADRDDETSGSEDPIEDPDVNEKTTAEQHNAQQRTATLSPEGKKRTGKPHSESDARVAGKKRSRRPFSHEKKKGDNSGVVRDASKTREGCQLPNDDGFDGVFDAPPEKMESGLSRRNALLQQLLAFDRRRSADK